MTAKNHKPKEASLSTALKQTVEALRADSLRYAEGELIGSEDELLLRHGVSRPTLRQAAALVAQEQLLQVRRGVGGGYIARRPTGRAVAHMAAIYLRAHKTSLEEIILCVDPLRAELARLAASNLDDDSRRAFNEFLERDAELDTGGGGYRAFIKSEREFGHLLGQASRNRVMALFLDILYDLAANVRPEHDIFLGRPERVAAYRERRARLIHSILDGEPDVVELRSRRTSELNRKWMIEDLGHAYAGAAEDPPSASETGS